MKKVVFKILKITWLIIGGLLLLWTGYWYFQAHVIGNLGGVLVTSMFFGMGLAGLLIFAVLTIIFLLIKFGVKLWKNKK